MNRWTILGCALALGLGVSACDGDDGCDLAADGVCPAGCPSDPDCTPDAGSEEDAGSTSQPVVMADGAPADFSCIGVPTAPPDTGAVVTFTGLADDFQDGGPVEGLTIQVFPDNNPTTDGTCAAPCFEVTSGADGTFSVMDNEGSWYAYRVEAGEGTYMGAPAQFIEAVVRNNVVPAAAEEDTFLAVRASSRDVVISLLGVTVEPGTATVTGAIADCAGNEVSNAKLRLFDSSGQIDTGFDRTGPREFYFNGESFPAARQELTNTDGLFGVANVPIPGDGVVRVELWGVIEDGGEPVLLGCEETNAIADGITTALVGPLRADAPAGCGG